MCQRTCTEFNDPIQDPESTQRPIRYPVSAQVTALLSAVTQKSLQCQCPLALNFEAEA